MEYQEIKYETKKDVALVTLNRPDKLNAWTPRMCEEQVDAIRKANEDKSVGAIIMTGAGRGFCAGADIGDTFQTRLDGEDPGNDTVGGSGGMPAGIDWIKEVRESKPIIAAVNGPAVGIGITMILPFDIIVTSEGKYFVFEKKSPLAESFREKFSEAVKQGKPYFYWKNRKYSTKIK